MKNPVRPASSKVEASVRQQVEASDRRLTAMSDDHARDASRWSELEAELRGQITAYRQQVAAQDEAQRSAHHSVLELSERNAALTAELASARSRHDDQAGATRQVIEDLRQSMSDRDARHEQVEAAAEARERALAEEVVRLRGLSERRGSGDVAAGQPADGLTRRLGSTGNLDTSDLVAYRDEIRREMLVAARARRRSQASDHETCEPLAFLMPGEDLCERLLFDGGRYRSGDPELPSSTNGLTHYLETGWLEGRSPHALFDGDWYLTKHPQAVASGLSPLSHYLRHGAAAGLQPHPCFDRAYYVAQHPDALRHMPDAFQHFLRRGLEDGYAPTSRIAALAQGRSLLDVLSFVLDEDLRPSDLSIDPNAWKAPLNDYWLPQTLRDYLGDEFGQGQMDCMSYLFSVIAAYDSEPDAFAASDDLQFLVERARLYPHRSARSRPDVSIIIPVYNNLVYTLTCIVSILEHRTSRTFELIVGDDCSTDATPQVIERLGQSVVLARHQTNLGFIGNCNACARHAQGRYLVILNNDTIVLPGWLDELIAPLASDMNIGMSGSKLINGDGTLQEAGGILWDDGSAWNYGRGSDPRLPHFNYSKDVDYCSGASIAIAKTLWDELDGFDLAFSPAYCEDSDLAFRVRAVGCRSWLAAASLLIHHEGRSHGRDVSTGIKSYQVTNQRSFFERWCATLRSENHPNAQNVFLARDRSTRRPHMVIIDHYIPQWDRDAGSRTMLHFIRMFVLKGFHVIFWPDNLHRDRDYAKALQDIGVEIIYGPQYVGGFEAWYKPIAEYIPYVLLSRPQIAEKYIGLIDRDHAKVLFYGHDLHWKRIETQWLVEKHERLRDEMVATRELEERICLASDVAFYPSREEAAFLRAELTDIKAAVAVPAWYFDAVEVEAMRERAQRPSTRDAAHLMFVGGFQHGPNVDGVLWFVREVWPIVKAVCGTARLTIAGSKPPESIRSLANAAQSIVVAGQISDAALGLLYAQATAAIIPLRFGGGVKGKVIEAFSKGIPVVSTEVGVQGMDGADSFCFVADDAETFAWNVLICVDAPEYAALKAAKATNFLSANYSLDALVRSFAPFVPELVGSASRAWASDRPA